MNIRKIGILLVVILAASILTTTMVTVSAVTPPFPNLPTSTISVTVGNTNFPMTVVLSGFGAGFDVTAGQEYDAYCLDVDVGISSRTYPATLEEGTGAYWGKVNYILNNAGAATDKQIQAAIWLLTDSPSKILAQAGFTPDAISVQLFNDAQANFVPVAGQLLAIEIKVQQIPEEDGPRQPLMIWLTIPSESKNGGLTPGFWKNNALKWEASNWVGYEPDDTLASAGFANTQSSTTLQTTLIDALQFRGGNGVAGAEQILLRAAVAALLNAANTKINYPLTTTEVTTQVNAALDTHNRDTILSLASTLDGYNNLGFDLAMNNKF